MQRLAYESGVAESSTVSIAGSGQPGVCKRVEKLILGCDRSSQEQTERNLTLSGAARLVGARRCGVSVHGYLVDPASSDMLVSKIKPCRCKYELT